MIAPESIFGHFGPLYRKMNYWARPVRPGTKAPPFKKWNIPDPERTLGELNGWIDTYHDWGIGIVLGSPFPDGTKLAAVDIDLDSYVRPTAALLRSPVCGRIGAKGIAFLVRLQGDGKYRPLKVRGEGGAKIGEILCDNRFLVLPPTIHPDTEQPYRWIGRPLLDVDFRELPILEA